MIRYIYNMLFGRKLYALGFLEGYDRAKENYENVGKTVTTDEAVTNLFKDIEQYKDFYREGYLAGIKCFLAIFLKVKI